MKAKLLALALGAALSAPAFAHVHIGDCGVRSDYSLSIKPDRPGLQTLWRCANRSRDRRRHAAHRRQARRDQRCRRQAPARRRARGPLARTRSEGDHARGDRDRVHRGRRGRRRIRARRRRRAPQRRADRARRPRDRSPHRRCGQFRALAGRRHRSPRREHGRAVVPEIVGNVTAEALKVASPATKPPLQRSKARGRHRAQRPRAVEKQAAELEGRALSLCPRSRAGSGRERSRSSTLGREPLDLVRVY